MARRGTIQLSGVDTILIRGSVGMRTPRTIGERITAARQSQGLTTLQCARRIGVSVRLWECWELDAAEPNLPQGVLAARVLGVPVFWLSLGEK